MIESKARFVDMTRSMNGNIRITFELAQKSINELRDVDLRLTVKEWKESRSDRQNRLLWECIGRLAKALRADKWDIYLLMLKRYGQYEYIAVPSASVERFKKNWREVEEIGTDGEQTELLCFYGSSTYDTEEFSILLDGVISEMKEAGIPTPAQEEIERWLTKKA